MSCDYIIDMDPAIAAAYAHSAPEPTVADAENVPDPSPYDTLSLSVDQPVWILLSDNREISGILKGVDNFFSVVLEDVTILTVLDGETKREHVPSMALARDRICVFVPGESIPE